MSGSEIVGFLANEVIETRGDPKVEVTNLSPAFPGNESALSFLGKRALVDSRITGQKPIAGILLTVEGEHNSEVDSEVKFRIIVENPRLSFSRVAREFFEIPIVPKIHPTSQIHPSAKLGKNVYVGPHCVISEEAVIGDLVQLGSGTFIGDHVLIGAESTIGANCTIGQIGFGYEKDSNGIPFKVPHFGAVVIGNSVDIGANTTIDRGTLSDTRIGDHVKIDNLVHVAHNCVIESAAVITAGSVLCGGVFVGERAWIAPNSTVREKRRVGSDSFVGMGSVVVRNVADGVTVFGNPAAPIT